MRFLEIKILGCNFITSATIPIVKFILKAFIMLLLPYVNFIIFCLLFLILKIYIKYL